VEAHGKISNFLTADLEKIEMFMLQHQLINSLVTSFLMSENVIMI